MPVCKYFMCDLQTLNISQRRLGLIQPSRCTVSHFIGRLMLM